MTALAAPMCARDQALKRATRQLVDAAGGCETAASLCRLGKSQLAAAGSVTEPERWLPVDVLRELIAVTQGHAGQLAMLRLLAADAGFVLVPVAGPELDPLRAIARLSAEAADVVAQLAAHADGRADAAAIIKECDELITAAVGIRSAAACIERGEA